MIIAVGKLRSTTLTIAVLVVFVCFILTLATFLRLVLSGLAGLLALSWLFGLTTVCSWSGLAALLPLLLHIVCHKTFLLRKRKIFVANLELSCCRGLQRLGGILVQFITINPGCQPIKRRLFGA